MVQKKKWSVIALKSTDIKMSNLMELKALPKLGVVRGDVREEWLINRDFSNLYSVTQPEQNISRLLLGRVPAIVYEYQGLAHICREKGIDIEQFISIYTLHSSSVYIAMSKPNTDELLVKKWQQAYNSLKQEGKIREIALKWQKKLLTELEMNIEIENDLLKF